MLNSRARGRVRVMRHASRGTRCEARVVRHALRGARREARATRRASPEVACRNVRPDAPNKNYTIRHHTLIVNKT